MRTGAFIALAAVGATAKLSASLNEYKFEHFVSDFNKVYANEQERAERQKVFEENMSKILSHNAVGHSWTMTVNQHADLTQQEFKNARRGTNGHHARRHALESQSIDVPPLSALPASVDWRTKNVISPIKDQGGCGSCWAFGSVETMESHIAIKTGKIPILSTQNVVSCAKNPEHCGGTGGCQGATAEISYDFVAHNGIATEKDYPYQGVTGLCNTKVAPTEHITGYVKLPENNYTAVMGAIATVGPQAINVDAAPWQLYDSGVFEPTTYATLDIDHVVQLVGYGTEAGKDYWIVRNSWGHSWGEDGFMRIIRHDGDPKWCGIDSSPADGTACMPYPKKITACGASGILYDVSYPTV